MREVGRDGRGLWESREIPPVDDLITPCCIYQVFGIPKRQEYLAQCLAPRNMQ